MRAAAVVYPQFRVHTVAAETPPRHPRSPTGSPDLTANLLIRDALGGAWGLWGKMQYERRSDNGKSRTGTANWPSRRSRAISPRCRKVAMRHVFMPEDALRKTERRRR